MEMVRQVARHKQTVLDLKEMLNQDRQIKLCRGTDRYTDRQPVR